MRVWQGRWPDHLVRVLGLVGYSVPVFWLGLMGLLLFYAKLGWVEGPGRLDVFYDDMVGRVTGVILIDAAMAGEWDVFWNALSHVILPASILGYCLLGLHRPHDPLADARAARPGIRRGGAGQGRARMADRLEPRACATPPCR